MERILQNLSAFNEIETFEKAHQQFGWFVNVSLSDRGAFDARIQYSLHGKLRAVSYDVSKATEHRGFTPPDIYTIFTGYPEGLCTVNGKLADKSSVIVMPPKTEYWSIHPRIRFDGVQIPCGSFEQAIRISAPGLLRKLDKNITVWTDVFKSKKETEKISRLILRGPQKVSFLISQEKISRSLCEMLALIAESKGYVIEECVTAKCRRQLVARARDFIEANLDNTVTMGSLCRMACTSLRTLERSFQEVIGRSPVQYIKLRRFNAAYRKLLGANPQETTVTDTALCYKLDHFGRFSVNYRQLFGESPSITLKRPASSLY
jgi:AraC-like DNA-binding protein